MSDPGNSDDPDRLAVDALSDEEVAAFVGWIIPAPWRDCDPQEEREEFAALLPPGADRELFLGVLSQAAAWYATHKRRAKAASAADVTRNEEARRQLESLNKAAARIASAYDALGPLARHHLGLRADAAGFEAAFGLVEKVRNRGLRDADGTIIAHELTSKSIVYLAEELGRWAAAAKAAVPKDKRGPDAAARSAVRKIGLAWWIATGSRPAENWSRRPRPDDPEKDAGEAGPVHVLAPRLLNPARRLLGLDAKDSFDGLATDACGELAALERRLGGPPPDVYAGLEALGDPFVPRD